MSLQGVRSLIWGMSDADARPLVIVDGHSESFDRLKDFDMQRIASVALLKNTTATALYGVRAGQGVIVITTKVPETHPLRLTYNFDGTFQRAGMRAFDMMDARAEARLGEAHGRLRGQRRALSAAHGGREGQRLDRLARHALRTSFSHRHRVSVYGGDSSLRYRGVLYMNPVKGVMKGSKRTMYGASAFIGYTTRKLEISNELGVDMADASESTYGR